jgi:hypothetical protein
MGQYFTKSPLPKEMKSDPLFNKLDIAGPFGEPHARLRDTYYAKRDNKPIPFERKRIMHDYEFVCKDSPGLWSRSDDTPIELNRLCNEINAFLSKP